MAAKFEDRVLDLGLNVLDTETTHVELCSQQPANYTEASSTYNLGTMNFGAGAVFGSPAARSPNGRKVAAVAVTAGVITGNGTATYEAWTDHANSRLHGAAPLVASQVVTSGNSWARASYDVGLAAS